MKKVQPTNGMMRPTAADQVDDNALKRMWEQLHAGDGLTAEQAKRVFEIGKTEGRRRYTEHLKAFLEELENGVPAHPSIYDDEETTG